MNKTDQAIIEEFRQKFNLHMTKGNGEEWIGSQDGYSVQQFLLSALERVRKETIEKVEIAVNKSEDLSEFGSASGSIILGSMKDYLKGLKAELEKEETK